MMAEKQNKSQEGGDRDTVLTECVHGVDYLPSCCDKIPQVRKRKWGQAINPQDPPPMTHYFH